MSETCLHYIPWDRYESAAVKTAECEHWSGDFCQRHDTPNPCPKPWLKKENGHETYRSQNA